MCEMKHLRTHSGGALGRWYCLPGHAVKHPCALILGFLPRKVLVGNTTSPASPQTQFIHQKPLAYVLAHSRGCAVPYFRTVSDMDVATELTWTYLQRVLKKGTARPLIPRRSTNMFPIMQPHSINTQCLSSPFLIP